MTIPEATPVSVETHLKICRDYAVKLEAERDRYKAEAEELLGAYKDACETNYENEVTKMVAKVKTLEAALREMVDVADYPIEKWRGLVTKTSFEVIREAHRALTQTKPPCPECKAAPHKLSCSRPEEKP